MGSIESNTNKTITKLEDQIERWGAKLDDLVAKVGGAGQDVKLEARAQLDELRSKLVVARSKLDAAKAAGDDKWDAFKEGVESSWKELESAFKKLTH